MSFWHPHSDSPDSLPHVQALPRAHPRSPFRSIQKVLVSLLLALLLCTDLLNALPLTPPTAHAAAFQPFASSPGTLTLQQFLKQGRVDKAYHGAFGFPAISADKGKLAQAHIAASSVLPSAEPAKMKPISVALDSSFAASGTTLPAAASTPAVAPTATATPTANAATGTPVATKTVATATPTVTPTPPATTAPQVVMGSDGRLEVDVPRGSLDFSKATLVGGGTPVAPLTLQITQLSGHATGSNNLLGTYQIQVVDSQGKVLNGIVVRQPLTIRYHYQPGELDALALDPTQIFLTYPALLNAARAAKQPTTPYALQYTNDAKAQTLTVQTSVLAAATTTTGGPSMVVPPPSPLLASVSGNSGQLTFSYPISVPPGPGGYAPQLQLAYSSQATNGRNDARSPAGSAGDGWDISLGSISAEQFTDNSPGGKATWYSISGVGGISDRLVKNSSNSTYVTQHLSYLRITNKNSCFQVWSLDGTYYELGCTDDSKQYYTDSSNNKFTYRYDVDRIVAPFDDPSKLRMMLISYEQDTKNNAIRDAVIKQVQYGLASSLTASSLSTTIGTVDFRYHGYSDDAPWVTAYGRTNYNCSTTASYTTDLRCDDTRSPNSVAPPNVMSTYELDSITSYVGDDKSSSHTAFQYLLHFQDDPANQDYTDPATGQDEGAAGHHMLKSITPLIYQNGKAIQRKGVQFNYTLLTNTYHDAHIAYDSTAYQPSTTWPYLTSYQDSDTGIGGVVTYSTAYSNTRGTPYVVNSDGTVDDRHDPLYCTIHANDSNSCSGSYTHPDEKAWSIQVVTQTQNGGTDSGASGLAPATTSYHYQLGVISSNSSCHPISVSSPPGQGDCVSDVWSPPNDNQDKDWQDYYHSQFIGFNVVYITSPASNLTADYYGTTEGLGTDSADVANYTSGQLYQEDIYQGNQVSDSALLKRTVNTLAGTGSSKSACNSNLDETFAVCLREVISSRTTDYEGTGSGNTNAPWIQTDSTYDDYTASGGLVTSSSVFHELLSEATSAANAPTLTKKMSYQVNNQTKNSVTYYRLVPTHSELDDSNGHVWQCEDSVYDEGISGPQPSAGWITIKKQYSNCSDKAHTALSTYTGYDAYGNVVASVDAFGASNSGIYGSHGCTPATTPIALPGAWTAGHYTTCTDYDSFFSQPVNAQNVFAQSTKTTYDYTQGAVPISTIDINGQTTGTSYTYDNNGDKTIALTQPGETGTYTRQSSGASSCTASSQRPCYEVDSVSSLYPGAVKQTFYDQLARTAEIRTPGPDAGHDTIVFTVTNDANNSTFQSVGFRVPHGKGWIDPNTAKDETGTTPAGTATYKDALGRTLATQDPLLGSASEPGMSCPGLSGLYTSCTTYGLGGANNDSATYAVTLAYDPNHHMVATFADATGRERYTQWYSQTSSLSANITTQK